MHSKRIKRYFGAWLKAKTGKKGQIALRQVFDNLARLGRYPDEDTIRQSKLTVWKHLEERRISQLRKTAWIQGFSKYAAVFILLGFTAWVYWQMAFSSVDQPEMIVKQTLEGMRSTITLSDGSQIRLNENSEFEFPEAFLNGQRLVRLEGEAFFDITPDPDKPFIVQTGNAEIVVLGTSFNINTHQATEVTVASGKVKVANRDSREQAFLQPGQQAVLDGKAIRIAEVNPEYFLGWHTRKLSFEEEPVEKVFEILERAYGVEIHTTFSGKRPQCLITGTYEGERIETILRGMKHLLEFDYQTDIRTKTISINIVQCK
ncbi:FecR family protein [Cyclobacterium sp.]|uniref:FecR family protein n=1 Tax=Cyclobacterium sp. TaxID=1966343 RepID=UPI0019974125|nr:FecR family protein [Cyclobacterium sp.]MBD3631112.1 FecR domain-containing protein [Cyclobacterium sp.]